MSSISALEWCDANMHNKYPIADDATTLSVTGIYLPSSFLVDMQIILPGMDNEDAADRLFISAIEKHGDLLDVFLSYHTGTSEGDILCAAIDNIPLSLRNTSNLADRTFSIRPVAMSSSKLSMLSGRAIIGSCIDMGWVGRLEFSYEATKLLSLRVYVVNTSFQHITVCDSLGVRHTISDNFILEAGDGIDINVEYGTLDGDDSSAQVPVITISKSGVQREVSVDGTDQTTLGSVDDVVNTILQKLGNPVRYINSIPANDDGEITIQGDDCTQIAGSSAHVLTISNPCAKPCCTDASVADVRASLDMMNEAQTRLLSYYFALSDNINSMQARLASLILSVE